MLARERGSDPHVRYVNLGDAVDLTDPALSYDHMHLTARGNRIIADALLPAVLEMAKQR
jgi:lysophospholipase L1-like esterase